MIPGPDLVLFAAQTSIVFAAAHPSELCLPDRP